MNTTSPVCTSWRLAGSRERRKGGMVQSRSPFALHVPVQQSAFCEQPAPSALQLDAVLQTPLRHTPEQHSEEPAQPVPYLAIAATASEASPVPSIETMQMGLAHIPTSNSCLLCHTNGGDAGLKPIPALGHPVQDPGQGGWIEG